jgi:hypothetical protein
LSDELVAPVAVGRDDGLVSGHAVVPVNPAQPTAAWSPDCLKRLSAIGKRAPAATSDTRRRPSRGGWRARRSGSPLVHPDFRRQHVEYPDGR